MYAMMETVSMIQGIFRDGVQPPAKLAKGILSLRSRVPE
jgi:hypothetical protein